MPSSAFKSGVDGGSARCSGVDSGTWGSDEFCSRERGEGELRRSRQTIAAAVAHRR
jgi:hypothetical protein